MEIWGDMLEIWGDCISLVEVLRGEQPNIGAGARCCAVSSEHRVSTREASTAYAAEDGGVRLKTRPRECWLGMQEHAFRFKSEYGGVRVLSSAGWDASREIRRGSGRSELRSA